METDSQNVEQGTKEIPLPESFLDRQFVNMSGCGLTLLILVLPGLALILGIVGLIAAKHPKARERSGIMLAWGAVLTFIGFFVIYVQISR